MFDYHTEHQVVPKLLPQVSVKELHNSLVSDTNYGGLKDARDEDDNIIISGSTLCSLFPPQLKQISAQYKVVCGCECFMEIYPFLSRVFHWNILVHYQRQISINLHHHVNVMQYLTLFCLMTANKMLTLLLHTEIVQFHCSGKKIIDNIIDYNMVKH